MTIKLLKDCHISMEGKSHRAPYCRQRLFAFLASATLFSVNTVLWWSPALQYSPILDGGWYKPADHINPCLSPFIVLLIVVSIVLAGYTADTYGRKVAILALSIPFFFLNVILLLPRTALLLNVSNVLASVAVGVVSVQIPIYIGEIADPAIRGKLLSYTQLIAVPAMHSKFVADFLVVNPVLLKFYTGILTMLVLIAFGNLCPETPTYLLLNTNRNHQAASVLMRVKGLGCDVAEEVEHIEGAMYGKVGRATVALTGLLILQPFCGADFVVFYAESIVYRGYTAAFVDKYYFWVYTLLSVAPMVSIYCCTLTVDTVGRRPLLVVSCAVMAFSMFACGVFLHVRGQEEEEEKAESSECHFQVIPFLCIVVYVYASALGLTPVTDVFAGELMPSKNKAVRVSVAYCIALVVKVVLIKCVGKLTQCLQPGSMFWVFAAISTAGLGFAYMVPETKKRSLKEIQDVMRNK